jgi:uncharacterized protein (PEP-CTERM system associated)
VLSSVDASLLLFDPTGLGSTVPGQPGFNPIASRLFQQNLLLFGAQPLDVTLLSNALVLDKRLVATGGLTGLHNSLLATIYYNTRESAGEFSQTVSTGAVGGGPRGSGAAGGGTVANAFTGRLQQHGLTVGYQHRLDAATTANVTVRRNYTEVEGILAGFGPGGDTTLTQFLIGLNTRLTVDTTAGVGLRRTTQRRNGNFGADYTENAVIGTLDMRF